MTTTKSIIVYSNPLEAAMWDAIMNSTMTWMIIPIIGGVAAVMLFVIWKLWI